jgi:hypothetical protein
MKFFIKIFVIRLNRTTFTLLPEYLQFWADFKQFSKIKRENDRFLRCIAGKFKANFMW